MTDTAYNGVMPGMELPDEGEGLLYEHFRIEADRGMAPVRIDKFLSEKLQHSSRNRIQKAAEAGFVHVGGQPVKSNYKVRPGDVVTLMLDRPRYDSTTDSTPTTQTTRRWASCTA